ncbi:protein MOS2-like [Brachypodium distachyon]|uniref:protein MOS2-like n=1 Tax=Brachypodium distachyon TaxID=15368 RepID=UPI000530032E|nr:protein MOS2-like [Brachypodium distachyon]|eukprot:XP_010229943.1 protein MOS2-like [Brachypodium distachyon]
MEKMQKVSSIPSKPRPPKTATRPAAFAAAAGHSGPAPRFFVTTFDPSKSLTPAPAPLVIPPLPNTLNPTAGDGPAFVLAASADASSSSLGYGLTPSGGDLTLRRFNDDMATLPDIQGAEEYEEVPVEGFGAALLAGYGWKKGDPIGRDKSKRDAKAVERGRRFGTQGLGSDPSKETASPSRSRRPLPAGREGNMSSKKKKKKQRLE